MEISDFRLPPFFFSFKKAEIQLITLVKKIIQIESTVKASILDWKKLVVFWPLLLFFRLAKLEFVYLF